jgi:hypothetical protein
VRQWTADTRKWYIGGPPFFQNNGAGHAYVFIYGMLTLAFIVLMLLRGATFHKWSLGASQRLHKKMLHRCEAGPPTAAQQAACNACLLASCCLCCLLNIL